MVITIYSVPNCIYCEKAVALCYHHGCEVAIRSARDVTKEEWIRKMGEAPRTAPQVFIGSEHIGGYEDLKRYFENRAK